MLRGLDVPTGGTAEEPTIVKVAGRTRLEADLSVYIEDGATGAEADREDELLQAIDRLESAGILTETDIVSWEEADAGTVYDEFRAATAHSLVPHYQERDDDSIDVPSVCIAIRRDGELTGLYPRHKNGTDQTVEDCIRALCNGDRVENLA